MEEFDKVYTNARISILDESGEFKVLEESFLAIKDKKIAKIDKMQNLRIFSYKELIDVENRLITTSLIDCHTHLVYAKSRTNEFEKRLEGATYEEIAKSGGGIVSSIKSIRESSFDEIYKSSEKRLRCLIKEGVTTIEIKTGYGLDIESEIKMLKVMKALEDNYPIHIEKTFLAAHAVPLEYKNDSDAYINYICETMFDEVNKTGLIDAVDAYCEHLAFSIEQVEKVFKKAKSLGLRVKLHAEQFSSMGATSLACKYKALSVDHLEYTQEEDIKLMKETNTVAVLLPGAYYFLRETKLPLINLFRKHKVAIAIASDLNPGTSALCSLQLMMNMAAVIFSLSVKETFLAVSKNAALALGLEHKKGELKVAYDADFCVWDVEHIRDLVCSFRPTALHFSVYNGEVVNV